MTTTHNPNCDGGYCKSEHGETRRLPTGGDSNALLCYHCYLHEMAYRIERNAELGKAQQYKIPSWESLERVS